MRRPTTLAVAAPLAATAPLAPAASGSILAKLLLFFLKAGSLTFGSGLVIVPFLEQGLVREYGWLDQRQFLIAVAIGMISPGPVVITATFVGYLVAGFWGSLVSTVGIFLPSFILVLIAAPILARHRANANVQGFVKGAYAAAIGTILGACVLLGRIAIGDWLTALIGAGVACRLVPLEGEQSHADRCGGGGRTYRLSASSADLGDGEIRKAVRMTRRNGLPPAELAFPLFVVALTLVSPAGLGHAAQGQPPALARA